MSRVCLSCNTDDYVQILWKMTYEVADLLKNLGYTVLGRNRFPSPSVAALTEMTREHIQCYSRRQLMVSASVTKGVMYLAIAASNTVNNNHSNECEKCGLPAESFANCTASSHLFL